MVTDRGIWGAMAHQERAFHGAGQHDRIRLQRLEGFRGPAADDRYCMDDGAPTPLPKFQRARAAAGLTAGAPCRLPVTARGTTVELQLPRKMWVHAAYRPGRIRTKET